VESYVNRNGVVLGLTVTEAQTEEMLFQPSTSLLGDSVKWAVSGELVPGVAASSVFAVQIDTSTSKPRLVCTNTKWLDYEKLRSYGGHALLQGGEAAKTDRHAKVLLTLTLTAELTDAALDPAPACKIQLEVSNVAEAPIFAAATTTGVTSPRTRHISELATEGDAVFKPPYELSAGRSPSAGAWETMTIAEPAASPAHDLLRRHTAWHRLGS
jgi:hypothetical protein